MQQSNDMNTNNMQIKSSLYLSLVTCIRHGDGISNDLDDGVDDERGACNNFSTVIFKNTGTFGTVSHDQDLQKKHE